jgi:hypothetical protein
MGATPNSSPVKVIALRPFDSGAVSARATSEYGEATKNEEFDSTTK